MRGTWQTTSGGGSSGIGSAVVAVGAAIGIVAVTPLILAAAVAIAKALVIAAVALAVALIAAAAVAWRLRARRPLRELPVRRPLPHAQARVLPARQAQPTAIENHYHFHGVSAEEVAEAIARRQEQSR